MSEGNLGGNLEIPSQKRVAVLFKGTDDSIITRSPGTRSDNVYYMLSLREAVGSRKPLCTAPVESYDDVVLIPWPSSGPMRLNYEDSLSWMKQSRSLFGRLFFPEIYEGREVWMFTHHYLETIETGSRRLSVPLKRLSYKTQWTRKSGPMLCLRFQSEDQFCSLFFPEHVGLVRDAVFLGVDAGNESAFDELEMLPETAFLRGLPSSISFANFFRYPARLEEIWRYTVKQDYAFFDLADSVYCLPYGDGFSFETALKARLETNGYHFYQVPLSDPIAHNWAGYGQIPVLLPK